MKNRLIAICAIGISVIAVSFVALNVLQGQKKEPERVTKMPEIVSKIDTLEILTARTENEGKAEASAVLELRNNSNKSIIAVTIESGDEKNSAGITESNILDGDGPPVELVKPFDTYTLRMSFGSMLPGLPVRISGVLYADGSADGEKATVEMMQRHIEQRKMRKQGVLKQ